MPNVRAHLERLAHSTREPPAENDLTRLAQLHTECQSLVEEDGALGELARRLGQFLEGVILKEAADPAGGLRLVPAALHCMACLARGEEAGAQELLAGIQAATRGDAGACSPARPGAARPSAGPPAAGVSDEPAGASGIEPYVPEPLVLDLDERDHLQGFIDESREHVDSIEAGLLAVERNPADSDKINELFRPFHTIKGIAGFLNLRDINRLTHEVETLLDLGRRGELRITHEVIDMFFAAIDQLKRLIDNLAARLAAGAAGPAPQPDITEIMGRLRRHAALGVADSSAPGGSPPQHERPRGTAQAPGRAGPVSDDPKAVDPSIRVDTTKLDTLVNAVGELVIAQTMVNQNATVRGDETLSRFVTQVTKIVRDVQETSMSLRMIPIGGTLTKMRRLARDVARKGGKQVELRISGEETELDKNVIQAISDPLVHMVRNAVDHGIEPPERRRAAGKPAQGRVDLSAYYQGDSIVIEIRDDGRGLDRESLVRKAVERGLIGPNDPLTDPQAFQLVFQPGLSTAAKITDISGRGVGMDVVKRNIENIRGKIDIQSQPGAGSRFRIRLPLTLAIIDGMLVRVGRERLIIPTIMIERSLRPERAQLTTVQGRGQMLRVRGELIALAQLGRLFGYSARIDPAGALVVVTQTESEPIGIVVNELIGQQQVVIKTLGDRFKTVKGVSGAAILGDGRVGLILEPTGLLALHNESVACASADRPARHTRAEAAPVHPAAIE